MVGHGKVSVLSGACQKKNVTDTYFIHITTKEDIFTRERCNADKFILKTLTTNYYCLELKLPFKALFLKHDIEMHDFTLH